MIKESKFLTSNNFANISDFIFSEVVSKDKFYSLPNFEKLLIINESKSKEGEYVWYLNPNLDINENDVVFCHSEVVEFLFKYLKDIQNVKNIKLITHQSDRSINKKLFLKKPNCISEWYGTNVVVNSKNLISIPLGIGNEYLNVYKDQKKTINKLNSEKKIKNNSAFMNFRINTNTRERLKAFFALSGEPWINIKYNKQSPEEYLSELDSSAYTICPWGNGYDTHRIWESLYLGSIPVTKYHHAYDQFKDLPIIFIKRWKNIDTQFLSVQADSFQKNNLEKLYIDYWEKKIKGKNISSIGVLHYFLSEKEKEELMLNIRKKLKLNRKIKNIKTFLDKFYFLKVKHYFTFKNN